MKVDVHQNFSPTEVTTMERLVDINSQIKALETEKQKLVEKVKRFMQAINVSSVDVNGTALSLIESSRRTVTRTTKDQFIAELINMNKQHLVQYDITPDLDSIFAEVDAGTLPKDFVDKYVKVTPIVTLRCN